MASIPVGKGHVPSYGHMQYVQAHDADELGATVVSTESLHKPILKIRAPGSFQRIVESNTSSAGPPRQNSCRYLHIRIRLARRRRRRSIHIKQPPPVARRPITYPVVCILVPGGRDEGGWTRVLPARVAALQMPMAMYGLFKPSSISSSTPGRALAASSTIFL